MVSAKQIIGKVKPFKNKYVEINDWQDVDDIIDSMASFHKKYRSEYDKIYREFYVPGNVYATCKNIFSFLKKNVPYYIEPKEVQTLRSPSGIIEAANFPPYGADCKNYSLFIAGILDAINRNTSEKIPFIYRFASYDYLESPPIPGHVFIVVNPYKNEIWIDPVLSSFNEHKEPFYYEDYKLNDMALYQVSGIPQPHNVNGLTDAIQAGADIYTGGAFGAASSVFNFFSSIFGNAFNQGFTSDLQARAQFLIENNPGDWGAAPDQPPGKDTWFDLFINFVNDWQSNFPAWYNSGVPGQQGYKVRTDYIQGVFTPQQWNYVVMKAANSPYAIHFGNMNGYLWDNLYSNPNNPVKLVVRSSEDPGSGTGSGSGSGSGTGTGSDQEESGGGLGGLALVALGAKIFGLF